MRSKLSARDFASLIGMSEHTLYAWKKRFDESGPAGLADRPRGAPVGSRMSEVTKRAILMLKETHPDWGQERIRDVLMRSDGYAASAGAIARVLTEFGYVVELEPTRAHPQRETTIERARPNQLWQTDLFTFILKRENRRVWMVAFMDDHSRFIVGYGVYASSSGALVREVFEAALANFGAPEEVLTDNGPQYHTWRGRSAFRELLERRGIKQIVAAPRHPQTLGKIERFWGTLWRELLEGAIFQGIDDARRRIGHFIDHYNFRRTHTGIDGLVPADRFFGAASTVSDALKTRVASNALELALYGAPRKSFYLTGRIGDETIALHGQGGKVVMTKSDGTREEVDLAAEGRRAQTDERAEVPDPVAVHGAPEDPSAMANDSEQLAPGESPLESALDVLTKGLASERAAEVVIDQAAAVDDGEVEHGAEPTVGGAS
ncbi:MAG: DDE-type integrase/transposase/recombinase [Sandaracinaceae bacterium]|nr:DDE-type integrase/transposase/recombinase [Sandaracinaceae bacterium]